MSQDYLTSKNRKQLDNIAAEGFSKGSATIFFLGRHLTAGGQKLRDLPEELSVCFF